MFDLDYSFLHDAYRKGMESTVSLKGRFDKEIVDAFVEDLLLCDDYEVERYILEFNEGVRNYAENQYHVDEIMNYIRLEALPKRRREEKV